MLRTEKSAAKFESAGDVQNSGRITARSWSPHHATRGSQRTPAKINYAGSVRL